MKIELEFEKDPNGRWYAVLPQWHHGREALEMVLGADTLCAMLANGKDRVKVEISTENNDGGTVLYLVNIMEYPGSGADYYADIIEGDSFGLDLWLCDVLHWVFNDYPQILWIKTIENEG